MCSLKSKGSTEALSRLEADLLSARVLGARLPHQKESKPAERIEKKMNELDRNSRT